MMNDMITITEISKEHFRKRLKVLTRFFTFAQTGYSRAFRLMNLEDYLKDVEFPEKIKEGGDFYIDFPTKSPICVRIEPFESVYDLLEQIRDAILTASKHSEFGVPYYVKFSDLYVEKLTVCTSGDIIVYIKHYPK